MNLSKIIVVYTIIMIFTSMEISAFQYPYYIAPVEDNDLIKTSNIVEKTKNILTDKYNDAKIINDTTTVRGFPGAFTLLSLLLLYPEPSALSYSLANSLLENTIFSQKSKQATLCNIITLASYQEVNKDYTEMLKIIINHGGKIEQDNGTDYNMNVLISVLDKEDQTPLNKYKSLLKEGAGVPNSLFFGSDGKAKPKDDSDVAFFKPQKKEESKSNEQNADKILTQFIQALKSIAG